MGATKALQAGRQLAATLLLTTLLCGCVIIPVPVPGETYERYMAREDRTFIELGKTSRQQVLAALGSPTALSTRHALWVYTIEEYLSTGWEICALVVVPPDAGGDCPKKIKGRQKHRFLALRFDTAGIVEHREIIVLEDGECDETGFCWNIGPAFRTVNGLWQPPDWHCAVHLYSGNARIEGMVETTAGKRYELLLTRDNFQIVLLQREEPTIDLIFDDGARKRTAIPCDRASAHFVQVDRKASGYRVRRVPEHGGRLNIIRKETLVATNF